MDPVLLIFIPQTKRVDVMNFVLVLPQKSLAIVMI